MFGDRIAMMSGHPWSRRLVRWTFLLATEPRLIAPTRVYVDMVGNLFHSGHVALLRAARGSGDQLVVGGACR